MSNIDINLELHADPYIKADMDVSVSLNRVPLMSWVKTEASDVNAPRFTAIAQFKYEQWMTFGPDGNWRPSFDDGEESLKLEIGMADLFTASEQAVRAMFGRALDLQVVEVKFGYDVTLDGEVVLEWRDPRETGEFICFDTNEDGNMFMMFTRERHGFVPWNEGDHDYDEDTYEPRSIPQISMFAYRALLLSQGGAA